MGASGPKHDRPVAIRVEDLTLARGDRELVRGLAFEALAGQYLEIRGRNGAGKTTLLRTLAGFSHARTGKIDIAGVEDAAASLHYVGHLNGLKSALSVRDHIRYWAGIYEPTGREEAAISAIGLARQADLPARVLSQGQARRLSLARLILAHRPIWLLDEPAAGLDSDGKEMLAELIRRHCAASGIVLAALHEPLGPQPAASLTLG